MDLQHDNQPIILTWIEHNWEEHKNWKQPMWKITIFYEGHKIARGRNKQKIIKKLNL